MAEQVEESLAELREQEPQHPTAEEAEHWLEIYEQLIAMTEVMMARTRDYLSGLHPPARQHVERVNVQIMEEELAGFRERHQVWAARVHALED
jgi:hypothetical protein